MVSNLALTQVFCLSNQLLKFRVSGGERIGSSSVEEIIGNALGDIAGSLTMGASGREDRNVRQL